MCARTDAPITGEIRTGVSVHMEFMKRRRWPRVPGRDSCGLLHDGGAPERADRFVPRNWSVGGQSACKQCGGRRPVSRRQRPLVAKQRYDPKDY